VTRYQDGMRRMLVDMHIPDWDPGFLAAYDPARMAELYERANLTSVMLYCKSHTGLCNWPTKVGGRHANLGERNVVAELVAELEARDIGACAYTSVVFDNWAVEQHPEWRQVRSDGFDAQDHVRYGFACLNNPEYRAYERDLLTELLTDHHFDAVFVDMPFWPLQCHCEHCRARFADETGGAEPPTVVDWTTPEWPAWQAARERWSDELISELAAHARTLVPGIGFVHNLAPALADYVFAQPLGASRHDDFVAGDLYGDRYEQLAVTKLSLHLSETRPAEFMTSRCVNLTDHVRIKREDEMAIQAAAATALCSAFLFIDAIDPEGTVNPAVFDRIGRIFARTEPFEPFLGGVPVEDVAVYFSVDSQLDFASNGTPVNAIPLASPKYPHGSAVQGACRALQRAHVPFGVVTRKQLDDLARWPVVVLPAIARMDDEEVAAFRAYVEGGGRLYASRYTSLVDTVGAVREDFGLADLFGVSFTGEEEGSWVYVQPAEGSGIAEAAAPQDVLSVQLDPAPLRGVPRVRRTAASVLATRTLPYGYPAAGNVKDHRWASIHSAPPWERTEEPTIVVNDHGAGRVVYAVAAHEMVDAEADEALFVHLVRSLLPGEPSFRSDCHPSVWLNAFDQAGESRMVVTLLNHQADLPPVPVPATFTLRPPAGKRFVGASAAPDGAPVRHAIDPDGAVTVELDAVEILAAVVLDYA